MVIFYVSVDDMSREKIIMVDLNYGCLLPTFVLRLIYKEKPLMVKSLDRNHEGFDGGAYDTSTMIK